MARTGRPKARLRAALERMPIVLPTGPRQAGNSTLARIVGQPSASNLFDLEDLRDLARLGEPILRLPGMRGTAVLAT